MAKQPDHTHPQPAMILVRPQMGENIGAAARAMLNFGLQHMRLVAPRDGWPNPSADAMASGAGRVLDAAQVFAQSDAALADLDYVFATTARGRDLTKPVMTPAHAMEQARALQAQGQRVGIMFGPERAGLENDDIARANAIITVPVNPDFPSLNLAQCVLLVGYEWGRLQSAQPEAATHYANTRPASIVEIEKLAAHFEERLEEAAYFWPEDKAPSMRLSLRNLWSRMPLTGVDVQIFHGMLRQLIRHRDGSE